MSAICRRSSASSRSADAESLTRRRVEHRHVPWRVFHDFEFDRPAIDVAAVSGWPEHAEVFVLDRTGRVWHRWWWKEGGWMVERFSLPSVVVAPGLVLFWLLPGIFLGILLLARPESSLEGSVIQLMMKDRERGRQ